MKIAVERFIEAKSAKSSVFSNSCSGCIFNKDHGCHKPESMKKSKDGNIAFCGKSFRPDERSIIWVYSDELPEVKL